MNDRDTCARAAAVQARIVAAMTPADRVRTAVEMSDDARAITGSGIRARHPDWPEARVRRELLTRLYGARLVERLPCLPSDG